MPNNIDIVYVVYHFVALCASKELYETRLICFSIMHRLL